MPLIHIVYGLGYGGLTKPARGFIAIGNIAIGVYAIGGLSIGTYTLQNDPQLREYLRSLFGNFQSNR
jgi:hypothetical protein